MKPGARPHCGIKTVGARLGQAANLPSRSEVFGQVEIVGPRLHRSARNTAREVEGQRVDDDVGALQQIGQAVQVGVELGPGTELAAHVGGDLTVGDGDLELRLPFRAGKQVSDGPADVTGAQNENLGGHGGPS